MITGATGQIGSELVRLFENDSQSNIRLLLRDEKNVNKFDSNKFEIVLGDLNNIADIEKSVKEVNKIFLLTSPVPEQVQLQKNLIDVASRDKNIHIVKISAMGIDPNSDSPLANTSLSRWHHEIEQYLENSGTSFTNIRPNFFMQNMLGFKSGIQKDGKFYGALQGGKISLVHAADIAAVAYAALNSDNYIGKTYDITGPEALSFEEVANQLTQRLGRRVEYIYTPPELLKSQLLEAGTPEWFANDILGFYAGHSAGYGGKITEYVEKLTNKKPISFKEFSSEFI